ncbi:hypothetical protein [Natronococcus occultus]|uniref:Uncharacterized protein n=1 Tax=Natronococcus occultus SP4 TaxID=694430 RepID=L0K3C3_9EURY|nr:hypothetical protein [Natronococcus occultus]AGB39777.1 hypothetical protein Natoc_4357 [Natronococcus occultus SP4]
MSDDIDLNDTQLALLAEHRKHGSPNDATVISGDVASQLDRLDTDALSSVDNPAVVDSKSLDRTDAQRVIEASASVDDPVIMSRSEKESLEENAKVARDALGKILREEKDLHSDTVDAMSLDALASEFRGEDSVTLDVLSQQPETGGAPDEDDEPNGDVDALSTDQREAVRDKLDSIDRLSNRTPEYCDKLKREVRDMVGLEDVSEVDHLDRSAL